jgi:hypothetical protein
MSGYIVGLQWNYACTEVLYICTVADGGIEQEELCHDYRLSIASFLSLSLNLYLITDIFLIPCPCTKSKIGPRGTKDGGRGRGGQPAQAKDNIFHMHIIWKWQ